MEYAHSIQPMKVKQGDGYEQDDFADLHPQLCFFLLGHVGYKVFGCYYVVSKLNLNLLFCYLWFKL